MSELINLEGQKFSRLTVISRAAENTNHGYPKWNVVCDCGKTATIAGMSLRSGLSQSCGCRKLERVSEMGKATRTHGHSYVDGKASPEYSSYIAMKTRCLNPKATNYCRYGGRLPNPVTIYLPWIESFELFLAFLGPRAPGMTLGRIDGDGNYEPGNVEWQTGHEQRIEMWARRKKPSQSVGLQEVAA